MSHEADAATGQDAPTNRPELSVSELADTLRRTIETNFDFVRVRGELGRVTIARSGHMYCDIKDDKAVLNTVMWKGQVSRLPFRPEEGLEVVAEGKLSIYAGRSNYQLLASSMRPASCSVVTRLRHRAASSACCRSATRSRSIASASSPLWRITERA